MATVRRAKWHPPPPQTPRILHLPRRISRRKQPAKNGVVPKGKLERMFDEERAFSYSIPPVVLLNSVGRRDKVSEEEDDERENEIGKERENEKWRFQAEMLRAECNLLRMEREIAVKKLHRERGLLQSSLKSALHSLLSGRKKIREGESVESVIEEEIEDIAKKLADLQRKSKMKHSRHSSSSSNFDKQACMLQKELEKLGEIGNGGCSKEVDEVSGSSCSSELVRDGGFEGFGSCSRRRSNRFADVEILKRKMERLSKGKLLKRMEEEYGSMLAPSTSSSIPNSASTSRRHDLPDLSSFSLRLTSQEEKSSEPKTCSGHCKAIVRRIMEQVRVETEQWSQMQGMLGQVREEMEELQASRDFWEKQALESGCQIQNLNSEAEEWKQKALCLESKENRLHEQVREQQLELEKSRTERSSCDSELKARKDLGPVSLGAQLAREKRALMSQGKHSGLASENRDVKVTDDCSDAKKVPHKNGNRLLSSNRYPFKDIGNLTPLVRQNSRRSVYPFHSPQHS